jgi:transcription elongation factor GreA
MSKSYLTQAGYDKLQEELNHLRTVRRQEVANRLHEAMADGDAGIDNDAEVDAAKNEQAFVEGRIRELELILSNARIIEEDRVWETVEIGAKVVIQENGTEPEKYTIVGAAEANPGNGYISNESPLGKALMGHKVGDVITVDAPNGKFTVTLVKVG